jgi:hypothetical protein
MNTLCYQAPPASNNFILVPCYILVRPDKQGCFQGLEVKTIAEVEGFKGNQIAWTTYDSLFKDPEVFFDLENAKDMCELVNTDIRNYREGMGFKDESSAFFVVLSIDMRVPWTGVKIEGWQEKKDG